MKADQIEMHESKFVSKCIDSVAQKKSLNKQTKNKNLKSNFS